MEKQKMEERRAGFVAGFAIACAELAKTHMEDDLAKQLWVNCGLTLDECVKAGVDAGDIETIRQALLTN